MYLWFCRKFPIVFAAWIVLGAMLVPAVAAPAQEGKVVYDVDVIGLKDGSARDLFKETSILLRQKKDPPAAFAILQQWIQKDIRTLGKILRARGFYAGRVSYQIDRRVDPARISLLVDPGPQYTIASVTLGLKAPEGEAPEGEAPESEVPDRAALETFLPKVGSAATSARILLAEKDILARLPNIGFPFAARGERKVIVRHADKAADVYYTIDTGPRVRFGPVRYRGLKTVSPGFLDRLLPWRRGDIYDDRKVSEYRADLAATSLFASVRVTLEKPDAEGRAPMVVTVAEAKQRSYGGGVSYSSTDGFGANIFWEHRNFLGTGERLRATATGTEIQQGVSANLTIPAFLRHDQKLIVDFSLLRDAPDAYTSYGVNTSAAIERALNHIWSVALGGSLEYNNIRDIVGRRNFYLAGALASVRRDSTNDLLDPRTGSRTFLTVRPYIGNQGGIFEFVVGELSGSLYVPLDHRRRYVIAARAKVGTIWGAELTRLPADKRFYAGGGQSVRGFGYQLAGDLDANGNPVGGRSLVEVGAEFRVKLTDTIGVVPFIEGGRAFANRIPKVTDNLFWGAGLGLRYYTSFAPVRLDVGFPLNPRAGDASFQVYVSLGQSF